MRHRVLKWARFVFRIIIIIIIIIIIWRTYGLMLIGWCAANIWRHLSSGEERNVEMCFASLGSMDCL